VDLLLERDRKIAAVECKIKKKPERKDLHGIGRLRKFCGEEEVPKAYVACPTDVSFLLYLFLSSSQAAYHPHRCLLRIAAVSPNCLTKIIK
jgi:hypothetical protein